MIALNQPLDNIKANVQKAEAAGRKWQDPHPQWKVNPLHVAVWRGNPDVIKFLLKDKKCDPKLADKMGFLPVHYAEAIGNQEVLKIIREATKVKYMSHIAFWDKLLIQPEIDPAKDLFEYVDETGQSVLGNSAKFAELTDGAIFTSRIFLRNRQALLDALAKSLDLSGIPCDDYDPKKN